MPGACRALARRVADGPLRETAIASVDHVVAALVDEIVRTSAAPLAKAVPAESAHEAWIRALGTSDAAIEGAAESGAQMAAAVRQWRRPVAVTSDAPFRLCFRLEEPKPNSVGRRPWWVR